MKMYEGMEAKRMLMPKLPILARIDGKKFSNFTKGLERPYDKRLSDLMVEVTKLLVKEYGALMELALGPLHFRAKLAEIHINLNMHHGPYPSCDGSYCGGDNPSSRSCPGS